MTGRRALLAAAAALPFVPRALRAQPRPIRVVVPFAPGGQSDTVMRLLQPKMAEALGTTIVVENRPGAGGAVGAGVVAASPPDGTTLFFDSFGFVVQPLIQRGLPFDYATAFAPVAQVVAAPYVLVVKADNPVRDIAGFHAWTRAEGAKLNHGSAGRGTPLHLGGELYKLMMGVDRKRSFRARLPGRVMDVLRRRGAWSFGPALWSTLAMTRRTAATVGLSF